ncbi:response regulator [Calditerrivibrio nitroreducens]|uniref:response regulator n=1 Tax=Calditerrivibrio nitroreducens TaxID=477976 RepID=UPI003C762ECF
MSELKNFLKNLNILIVDDDKVSTLVLKKYLDGVFNSIHVAENGKLGLLAFLQNKFDIIVTDVYMPEMDGIEMIKKIRQVDLEVPIVVITSSDDINDLKELLNLGIGRFIQKPITKSMLINALLDASSRIVLKKRLIKEKEMEIELLKYRDRYHTHQQTMAYKKEMSLLKNDLEKKKLSLNGYEFVFNSFYKPMEILCGDAFIYRYLGDGKILGVIMDTMGKGLSASVTSVLSVAFMNHTVDKSLENRDFDFITTLNSFLTYVKKVLLEEEMLSASFFFMDLNSLKCEYAHCGMPSILLKNVKNKVFELVSNNPPISKFTSNISTICIDLKDVDSMLIVTDGLVESFSKDENVYLTSVSDDFKDSLFYNNFENKFLDAILSFSDDVTIFYFKRMKPEKLWEINKELNTDMDEINEFLKEMDDFLRKKHIKDETLSKVTVSLYEFLMNAYEHGNLGIDVDKKHKLIVDNLLEDYCRELEKKCYKKIFVKYGIYYINGIEFFGVTIRDEGEGFNINMTNRALENIEYFCGRGIVLSNTFVDALYYNMKGNEVTFYVRW